MHKGQFINNSGIIKDMSLLAVSAVDFIITTIILAVYHKNKDAFLATAFVVVVVVSFASLGSLLFHIPISFLLNDLTTWLNVACALYTPLKKHFFISSWSLFTPKTPDDVVHCSSWMGCVPRIHHYFFSCAVSAG